MMDDEMTTYVQILVESLQKKLTLLSELRSLALEQQERFQIGEEPLEVLEEIVDRKDAFIHQIDDIDAGFESIYGKVRGAITTTPALYENQIKQLKSLIQAITDITVELGVLEQRNKQSVELSLRNIKREVKSYKVNSRTVGAYYKNSTPRDMSAFFVDENQ